MEGKVEGNKGIVRKRFSRLRSSTPTLIRLKKKYQTCFSSIILGVIPFTMEKN